MEMNTLLMILLGILVVMAGIQAFQISAMAQAISSGSVVSSTPQSSALSNLQSQVGGCG